MTPTSPGLTTPVFAFNYGWPLGTNFFEDLEDANWTLLDRLLAFPSYAQPSTSTLAMDGNGRIHTITETIAGKTRTTTLNYKTVAAQTVLDTVVVVIAGITRTVTYAYDANANLTGAALGETHA